MSAPGWSAPEQPARPGRVGRGCLLALAAVATLLVLLVGVLVVVAYRRAHETVEAPVLHDVSLPSGGEPLPEGHVAFDSDRTGNFEVFTMRPDGTGAKQLTEDPRYDSWWARISPDRNHILFYRTPAGVHDANGAYKKTSLWVMRSDGTGETELLPDNAYGWIQHGHAEWSPDGEHLVMFGGNAVNPQIWVTDATGRDRRQVTDRSGSNIDPSWSPDGTTIVFTGCPRSVCFFHNYEIYTVPAEGGDVTRLTDDGVRDHDPYFSPDGTRIAFLSMTGRAGGDHPAGEWNIRIVDTGGGGLRRVTDDGQVNSKPEWSRDGEVLWFHRLVYGEVGAHFDLWTVKPDGSDLTRVTDGPGANEYPST